MKVQSYNYSQNRHQSFTSLNNPIKSFMLPVNGEILRVTEETADYLGKKRNMLTLTKFFVDNFIEGASTKNFKEMKSFPKWFEYLKYLAKSSMEHSKALEQDTLKTSILVARDKKGEIAGAIFAHPNNEIPSIADPKTLYIRSIAVDKKYRKSNLGKIMMNEVETSERGAYTDSFVTSLLSAEGFYRQLGYEVLSLTPGNARKVLWEVIKARADYGHEVRAMHKVLNKNEMRWYDRICKNLDDSI